MNRSKLIYQPLIIVATFYPTMFFHELGHYVVLKNMGATIKSFIVGSPLIWRKGIFELGILPFSGYVWSSVNPKEIPTVDRIKIAASGPIAGLMFTSLVTSLFHCCNLSLCSIFYQHFLIGCLLDFLPTQHPDEENGSDDSDGSLIWLSAGKNWKRIGFWLFRSINFVNFQVGLLRLLCMFFTNKGLIQDIVDTYNRV